MEVLKEILSIVFELLVAFLGYLLKVLGIMFTIIKDLVIPQYKKAKSFKEKEKKVFVFGLPHAGKSTMTASLVKYLDNNENYILRRDAVHNREGVRILREWISNYYQGEFPFQTPEDKPVKVNIDYQNIIENVRKKITLYEIAGEDVIKFDPMHDDHRNTPAQLNEFLEECNSVLIVASSKPDREDEEQVIRDFIELILSKKKPKPILFVLTKYDILEEKYSDYIQAAKAVYPGSIKLLKLYEYSEVLPFSVGVVEEDSDKFIDNSEVYITDILRWIEGA